MFLQALSEVSPKMVDALAGNVVLAGGMWRVKGMQQYFKKRVKAIIPKFEKLAAAKIQEKLSTYFD